MRTAKLYYLFSVDADRCHQNQVCYNIRHLWTPTDVDARKTTSNVKVTLSKRFTIETAEFLRLLVLPSPKVCADLLTCTTTSVQPCNDFLLISTNTRYGPYNTCCRSWLACASPTTDMPHVYADNNNLHAMFRPTSAYSLAPALFALGQHGAPLKAASALHASEQPRTAVPAVRLLPVSLSLGWTRLRIFRIVHTPAQKCARHGSHIAASSACAQGPAACRGTVCSAWLARGEVHVARRSHARCGSGICGSWRSSSLSVLIRRAAHAATTCYEVRVALGGAQHNQPTLFQWFVPAPHHEMRMAPSSSICFKQFCSDACELPAFASGTAQGPCAL